MVHGLRTLRAINDGASKKGKAEEKKRRRIPLEVALHPVLNVNEEVLRSNMQVRSL